LRKTPNFAENWRKSLKIVIITSAPSHRVRGNLWLQFSFFFKKVAALGAGLPDGLFSNPKSQFGQILEGLCKRSCCFILWPFGIFYGCWGYFMIFDTFCVHLVQFFRFMHQDESGNPGWEPEFRKIDLTTMRLRSTFEIEVSKCFGPKTVAQNRFIASTPGSHAVPFSGLAFP
jgi:hypothetical protein